MQRLSSTDSFATRHIGPDASQTQQMLAFLGFADLDAMTDAAVPAAIRSATALDIADGLSEHEALATVAQFANENRIFRSYLGMGYSDTVTPAVLIRNILENPGWYTQYTPYQPEISQGRLEALLNFQTMVTDLTGMEIANASMLDESTAAAEAMTMAHALQKKNKNDRFFVAASCHPQTIAVVCTRAKPLNIEVIVADPLTFDFATPHFGALFQYPATDGSVEQYENIIAQIHATAGLAIVACDLLALTLLKPPGEFGADIAVGNSQRLGVPLGFGGPHAAFMATRDIYKRSMPGRLVGLSIDATGKPALRLALQTREQHIRRDKATSNICTAQVLLAVMASMYAAYHGPEGLRAIAQRVHFLTAVLAEGLRRHGFSLRAQIYFDTLRVELGGRAGAVVAAAAARQINLRDFADGSVGIALDETVTITDLANLLGAVTSQTVDHRAIAELVAEAKSLNYGELSRTSTYLAHPVFSSYHSETEMILYLHRLQSRDLSLTTSMIPLGSCTMKLNAAAEMLPITFPGFGKLHPFAPNEQTSGYRKMFAQLETWLATITGFSACSLQPNAGSQGEYAGLQVIAAYHQSRGQSERKVCLIPQSAHGTNPATAVMCGMQVVVVACDARGNIDIADLTAKADQHAAHLAALMVTYPSTHGVFESAIKDICTIIHSRGGQVYMDGANLNAQVGLTSPGSIGADVCHINLHKTFCIPHGGGGPGMGPICVAAHLAPLLPGHPVIATGGSAAIGPVSAAPWGSASILTISWMYIAMMGGPGLKRASQIAILNANYLARKLSAVFPILYTGDRGLVAHECIVDTRPLKSADIEVDDIAKRLMDYGFHAPTMSFPVPGTLMIEPTESESKGELDRFIEAMLSIRHDVARIEAGEMDRHDNPLKHAPHTAEALLVDDWKHAYTRTHAAYPLTWLRQHKFWPATARIDNAYGDRNLVCACPPISDYAE